MDHRKVAWNLEKMHLTAEPNLHNDDIYLNSGVFAPKNAVIAAEIYLKQLIIFHKRKKKGILIKK